PLFSGVREARRYRKCRPSGRKDGRTWTTSLRDGSKVVSGDATPPAAETCINPRVLSAKTIAPSRFHEPPTTVPCTSHSVVPGRQRSRFLRVCARLETQ